MLLFLVLDERRSTDQRRSRAKAVGSNPAGATTTKGCQGNRMHNAPGGYSSLGRLNFRERP